MTNEQKEKIKKEFYKFCPGAKENKLIIDWWLNKIDIILTKKRAEVEKLKRYDAWKNGFNVDMTSGFNQVIDRVLEILK